MRPIEEVLAAVKSAHYINDADALLRLADELDLYQTPIAEATASRARGTALFMRGEYVDALIHLQRALALFEEQGDRAGVARCFSSIGLLAFYRNDLEAATDYMMRANDVCKEIGDVELIPSIENHLALIVRRRGDFSTALEHFHRALVLYEQIGDRNGVAGAISNIGGTLYDTGDYPSALEHLHRALAMIVELGNRRYEAATILNIGNIYDSTGDYETALDHYRKAQAIYDDIGDKSGFAITVTCIGWTYQNMGNLATALEYHHRALALHQQLGEDESAANDLGNVILVLLEQKRDDEARQHFAAFDQMQIVDPVVHIWREQCRAELQLRDGDEPSASTTLHNALNTALERNLKSKAADVHKALRDMAQRRNDLAAYIEHNNAYTAINEELSGKNTAAKLATQEVERRIAAERQEHEKHLAILHSTLPKHIADRVARGEQVTDHYDNAAVIFLDVVGFTSLSSTLESTKVVAILDEIFRSLDVVCKNHNVVKIKTIGDSYLAVAYPRNATAI